VDPWAGWNAKETKKESLSPVGNRTLYYPSSITWSSRFTDWTISIPDTGKFSFSRFRYPCCHISAANLSWVELSWVEFYITTDSQPASLSWYKAPIWGLRPDLYYLYDSYGLLLVGRPLWREDGSEFYICYWPLPAQSFFGPSPLDLATIFYCLTFETSLFVPTYDSQGHGGGIRSRLHTGISGNLSLMVSQVEGAARSRSVACAVSLTSPYHFNSVMSFPTHSLPGLM
jgi:hypothetical protein